MKIDGYQLHVANEALNILDHIHRKETDKQMKIFRIRSEFNGMRHLDLSEHDSEDRKKIIDHISPVFFSEHAAWTRYGNAHLNDLLPLPLTYQVAKTLAACAIALVFLGSLTMMDSVA